MNEHPDHQTSLPATYASMQPPVASEECNNAPRSKFDFATYTRC